jgi:NitT/TauT family transport system substrate-binding protein
MRKKISSKSHLLRTLCVLLLVTVCCSMVVSCEKETTTLGEEKTSINFRLKWLIYSSFAPHLIAKEAGYYEQENLDVTIQQGGPGLDPIKLVASGADLVGLASYDQILIARGKEIPVLAIGEDTIISGVGFMSLVESGIKAPKDFVGKKVGVMLGTDKGTMYEALMNKCGIDRSKIVEIPIAFNLALLFEKKIDVFPAFITNQPIIARNKGFEVDVIDPYEYGIRPGGNVYFTTERAFKEKRGVLKRFLAAEMKGIVESQKMNNTEVIDIVLKYNPSLERASETQIWEATKDILLQPDPNKVGIMLQETWEHTADISLTYGLISRKPDLSQCYTNELIDEIHRENKKNL